MLRADFDVFLLGTAIAELTTKIKRTTGIRQLREQALFKRHSGKCKEKAFHSFYRQN